MTNDKNDWRNTSFNESEKLRIGIVIIGILFTIGLSIFGNGNGIFHTNERLGYVTNAFTELLSIGITIFIIDKLNEKRIEQKRTEDLILQMGGSDESRTGDAVRILKSRKQLFDGTLHNKVFHEANLSGVDLSSATMIGTFWGIVDLQDALLANANLKSSRFSKSDLRYAIITMANLSKASFIGCDFQHAQLQGANLQNAILKGAHFEGANLTDANLRGADFKYAHFDSNTTLPDSSPWEEGRLELFTDENHPQFKDYTSVPVRGYGYDPVERQKRIKNRKWQNLSPN